MKKLVNILLLLTAYCLLLTSSALAQVYPNLDISGYKKWEYKKADVSPQANYFSGLTQLGGFYPTFTGGPWQERLQLRILGQLSDNLSVTYDLEQQPETPERYDVKVKYYNNELTFGDFTANFSGNEFASTSKYLNGVMLTAKEGWYDVITVPSAKLKSQTQQITAQQGTNIKGPYNLGHGSIVEGSERIELNNTLLIKNLDYTIDYFEGKITFNRILTSADEFKYSYEYTNILDLFFPTLSKRDFFGFQSRFTIDPEEFGRPAPKKEALTDQVREVFPAAGSVESEKMEEEASGRYRLSNVPVVKFTENLTFMGTRLKKDEDYIIRYNQGQIKLLTRFLPSAEEPLTVEYKYFQTSAETEFLPGIDSRGPYRLSHLSIVAESERIEVDGKLFVRDLDYTIDYEAGEIIFGISVSLTSQIKAEYHYQILGVVGQPRSKYPKELKVGVTYLKESAKKSASTATSTVIEIISGQDIIKKNYNIYLQNRPILPTSESGATLNVSLDGRVLSMEVDYAIPSTQIDAGTGLVTVTPEATLAYINDRADPTDGYGSGTIKLFNTLTIASTSQVTVTYTYSKSVVGKFSGVGDGTRGPYYLRNIRNIAPGTETVQVWEQGSSVITNYTRNSSFEADAGSTGYSINYNEDSPSITFNEDIGTTKNFQIIYQYVPPSVFEGGDISQSVYGFDGSFEIGDIFKIDTAYAKSETDQVFVAETTYESFPGNSTKTYSLGSSKDLIEGSERIYVNDNLMNKDIDYYVGYTKPGQLTFYYITPTSQDAIAVEYQTQSLSGIVVGQTVKTGAAYRLGAETKLFGDVLTVSGKTKQIDHDFTPMGGTSIGLGSRYKEYAVKLKPDFHSFSANYAYKENNNPIGTYRTRFLRTYDNSISLGINPRGLAQIDLSYRDYKALDDLAPMTTTHESDSKQNSYTIGLTPTAWKRGQLTFAQKYDLKKTSSQSDSEGDSGSFSETNIDNRHANLNLKFTERVNVGYDYQISEPKTKALRTGSAVTETSSHRRSADSAYKLSFDLTPRFLQKLATRVSLLNHEEITLTKNFAATDEVLTTRNETYHLDLVPVRILNMSADHSRQERSTVVIGGTNPRTERTSANARLTPVSWLSAGLTRSQSEAIPATGINYKTTGNNHTHNINWTPFSFSRFKLISRFTWTDNEQTAPSGASIEVRTETDSFAQNYTVKLNPIPAIPIDLGLILENYQNKNNHAIAASRINTETQNQTLTIGSSVSPTPTLTLSGKYNEKTIKIDKDLNPSLQGQEKRKRVLDSKATYQVFSWGTLIYSRQDERNGGEIQAGAVASLNIRKTTQTYSLNITLPVDNAVLSNFVFIASVKSVDFNNLNNNADNFDASLATFEGTLNF
ncbi:hypothetical protein ACFL31_02645 [Candidatus Margulisiibacteriota bacterium]